MTPKTFQKLLNFQMASALLKALFQKKEKTP
jgi:hypothetical protein